ncbi:hypothetical protein WME92_22330 [Sorangium sp. So ce307]
MRSAPCRRPRFGRGGDAPPFPRTPWLRVSLNVASSQDQSNVRWSRGRRERARPGRRAHGARAVANEKLRQWIAEVVALCKPDNVHVCDGSKEEFDALRDPIVKAAMPMRLNPEERPDSYLARPTRAMWPASRTARSSVAGASRTPRRLGAQGAGGDGGHGGGRRPRHARGVSPHPWWPAHRAA